ncbi:hypothetical protein [Neolewinella antarctica]|uniref:Uncharacterized protein n=1 Tax=Neolewinella antarctica TaxID=442734 RepID=A0ABX0X8Q6_9BACT|nr:hypothetical protein [Neolewinella antarctica]NJC25371.1 hypothetical protein [Neolewinella antarctica]
MHPVQKHLMDTEFSGLEGTRFEGTIALSDELINLGILEALAKLKSAGQPNTTETTAPKVAVQGPSESSEPSVDPKALLQKLNVDKLRYRTEDGKTMVDIKLNFG